MIPRRSFVSFVAVVTTALFFVFNSLGCGAEEIADARGITVDLGDDTGLCKIQLPTSDGRVAWEDVVRAIARAKRLDDQALSELPSGDFKVTGTRARLLLFTVNQLLGPEIHLRVINDAGGDPVVEISIDRDQLRDRSHRVRSEIQQHFPAGNEFGLKLELEQERKTGPIIVLIHGYNATIASLEPLQKHFHEAQLDCGLFAYPNDGPISESPALLSSELRRVKAIEPHRPVILVTHSMGGLVARAAIEDPQRDPGNVRRLIMIAPPNHGSHMAFWPVGLDGWDLLVDQREQPLQQRLLGSLTDGWNEARRDLRPNSRFLKKLNARPRNPKIEYTVILGTGALGSTDEIRRVRDAVEKLQSDNSYVRWFGPRLDEYFSDLDELTEGTGDGVVSVHSGQLEGVCDVVLLPFRHNAVLRDFDRSPNAEVLKVVLARISAVR